MSEGYEICDRDEVVEGLPFGVDPGFGTLDFRLECLGLRTTRGYPVESTFYRW